MGTHGENWTIVLKLQLDRCVHRCPWTGWPDHPSRIFKHENACRFSDLTIHNRFAALLLSPCHRHAEPHAAMAMFTGGLQPQYSAHPPACVGSPDGGRHRGRFDGHKAADTKKGISYT